MMLKNILEKDIMQMLRLSTTLLTENPLHLNKAAAAQNISVKTIRRLLSSYLNEDPFFHYDVQQGHIRADRHLQQSASCSLPHMEMIAALFTKSANYQLLLLLLKMPTISFADLYKRYYLSPSSLHRRFSSFSNFLAPYQLAIDRRSYPLITGNERQLRYVLFRLTLLANPALISPNQAFQELTQIHQLRKTAFYPNTSITFTQQVFPKHFVPSFYLVGERSYLFLWKQLLTLEPFYVPAEESGLLCQIITPVLRQYPIEQPLEVLLPKIFQAHLLGALLEGNLFVYPPLNPRLSERSQRLVRAFLTQLPHYEKLLKKHPELPLLYECIWQDVSFFQPIIAFPQQKERPLE
ncbi:helix-turn-helix domain-containing protein [Enterococcus sp. AZ173]|uniref:helix-turn-helix domain-containing protein n=1 Tax=Enterococcus sp. AZ173 TaxID=2774700 RepID=UPI003D2DB2E7